MTPAIWSWHGDLWALGAVIVVVLVVCLALNRRGRSEYDKQKEQDMSNATDETLHVFWDGDSSFYVGSSVEDVDARWLEETGESIRDDWQQCPDDAPLTLQQEDGSGDITKTFGEWARQEGRGFLAGESC